MNVLIVGLGSIANKHIDALRTLSFQFKIYALRSKENSEEYRNIVNIYDLDKVEIDFDFAIISNPTYLHEKYIRKLSDKKIDLFIEKPPLNSLEGVEDLMLKLKGDNIKTYVACNLRFHPCILFIKNYLNENFSLRVNEVNVYCGSYLPDWRPAKDFRKIYSAIPELGGGVHLDLFHELDYTHWLFGVPESSRRLTRNKSTLNISSSDYANYTLDYEDFTVSIVLNYYRKDTKRTIEILFEEETLTIDLVKNIIINDKGVIIYENSEFKMVDTYIDQMSMYVDNLLSARSQINTFEDSIEVLKTCLGGEITE